MGQRIAIVSALHAELAEVVATYGISRSRLYELLARYRDEGEAAFEPRSRAPKTSPRATPPATVDLILTLRKQLLEAGHDAGAETIAWDLQQAMMAAAIPHKASPYGMLTLSIGVAYAPPGEKHSSKSLIEQADDHLYAAKNQGRNRVCSDSHTFPPANNASLS